MRNVNTITKNFTKVLKNQISTFPMRNNSKKFITYKDFAGFLDLTNDVDQDYFAIYFSQTNTEKELTYHFSSAMSSAAKNFLRGVLAVIEPELKENFRYDV